MGTLAVGSRFLSGQLHGFSHTKIGLLLSFALVCYKKTAAKPLLQLNALLCGITVGFTVG